jgi:hypothetical protein
MTHTRLAAAILTASALTAAGCGESTKPTSQTTQAAVTAQTTANTTAAKPSGPLNRTELIAKGDAICYRLNARRSATTIGRPQDYERVVPALAAYELAAVNEMSQLTPPQSMKRYWQQMLTGSRAIAEATGRFHTYTEASTGKLAHIVDVALGKGIDELTKAAKRAGFKECSHFA